MDEIKDAIQAARAQRITHMVSQFLKSENSDTEGSIQKGIATPEDDGVDYDDDNIEGIEKARSGVYADTAENRRLNRVGQQYGGKKQVEQPNGKTQQKKGKPILAPNDLSEEDVKKMPSKYRGLSKNIDKNGGVWYDGEVNGEEVSIGLSPAGEGWECYVGDKNIGEEFKSVQDAYKAATAKIASNRTYDIPHIMWAMGESSKMSAAVETLADVDFADMDEKEIESVVKKLPAKKLDELYEEYIGKSENERIFEKGIMGAELTPEEGAEMTELTKSDIMYAFSDGSDAIKLTKTGAEIKQQIQDVVRPELVTRLSSLKAQADEKLKDCGAAPTEFPDPYMTGGVAMDCGYKRYSWDAVYYDENSRQESITAEDDENKNGLRPESKEQSTARREYNDLVYQMYNVCADLKALELLSQVNDKKNYDLTPRQAACLKF